MDTEGMETGQSFRNLLRKHLEVPYRFHKFVDIYMRRASQCAND